MTVARLGYEIDSSGAVIAAKNLDDMAASAKKADNIADQLKISFDQMAGEIRAMTTTLNMSIKSMVGLSSAAQVSEKVIDSNTLAINELRAALAAMATQGSKPAQDETEKLGASLERLRSKYNPLYAASKQYEMALKEIARAEEIGAINATQAAAARDKAAAGLLSATAAGGKFSGAMQGSAAQTANLGAQLNDIGVMLAAGQNPLQLAVQQGTQINQVFAQMGGGKAALRGLAAGFMSMINPMSLATIGIIAGGAALVQWAVAAAGAGDEARDLDAQLDALNDIMDLVDQSTDVINSSTDDLIQKYGIAATRVREFALAQAELAQSQAERRLRDQVGLLDVVIDRYGAVGDAVEIAGYKMENDLQIANIQRDLKVGADQAFILMDAFTALGDASTFIDQQDALSGILSTMEDQGVALSLLPPELQSAISEMITLSNEADAAKAAMDRLAGAAANVSIGTPLFLQGFSGQGLLPPSADPKNPRTRRGGGGSRVDEFARDLESLRNSLRTEREVVDEWYMQQQEILANRRAMEILGIEGHNQAKLRLEQEYLERVRAAQESQAQHVAAAQSAAQGAALDFLGTLAGQSEGAAKALIAINTGLSVSQAIQNTAVAATRALAELGPIAGPLAAAKIKAFGAAQVGLILANGALRLGGGGSSSGTSASAGVTATGSGGATTQPQQAIIQLEGSMAQVVAPMMNEIVKQLQSQSSDGVIITSVVSR